MTDDIAKRLEELRIEIREERISYGELAELQSLADHIEDGDVELLEWAGVPEFGKRGSMSKVYMHISPIDSTGASGDALLDGAIEKDEDLPTNIGCAIVEALNRRVPDEGGEMPVLDITVYEVE